VKFMKYFKGVGSYKSLGTPGPAQRQRQFACAADVICAFCFSTRYCNRPIEQTMAASLHILTHSFSCPPFESVLPL
jgi:hypothetical protein